MTDAAADRHALVRAALERCPQGVTLFVSVLREDGRDPRFTSDGWDICGERGRVLLSSDPDESVGPFDQELHTYIDAAGLRSDFTLNLI